MNLDAIRRAHDVLMRDLFLGATASDATTGISEVDALLQYVKDDCIETRARFFRCVFEATTEVPAEMIRGRQAHADKAAAHLQDAARLLRTLDNEDTSAALEELARVIKALAATERLHVRIDSEGIAPGMRAMVLHQPTHRSTRQASARGSANHRANVIRHIAQALTPEAPLSAIARLVTAATGQQCTHADVGQALGRQKFDADERSTADKNSNFDLQALWKSQPPA